MAYLDYLKEKISYLRLLLAIDVTTAQLLAAWLVFCFVATPILRTCALIALAILVVGAIRGHYGISWLIHRFKGGE
jgi:hypothetical protein